MRPVNCRIFTIYDPCVQHESRNDLQTSDLVDTIRFILQVDHLTVVMQKAAYRKASRTANCERNGRSITAIVRKGLRAMIIKAIPCYQRAHLSLITFLHFVNEICSGQTASTRIGTFRDSHFFIIETSVVGGKKGLRGKIFSMPLDTKRRMSLWKVDARISPIQTNVSSFLPCRRRRWQLCARGGRTMLMSLLFVLLHRPSMTFLELFSFLFPVPVFTPVSVKQIAKCDFGRTGFSVPFLELREN